MIPFLALLDDWENFECDSCGTMIARSKPPVTERFDPSGRAYDFYTCNLCVNQGPRITYTAEEHVTHRQTAGKNARTARKLKSRARNALRRTRANGGV